MKRTILTGILALVAGAALLMAQAAPPAPAAPAATAAPAAPAGPHPKSPEETTALRAWLAAQNSRDPDAIIKTAEDVMTKFPDTEYKEGVLSTEAMAYKIKGDAVKEQVAWGRVLEASPNSVPGNLEMGGLIAKQTGPKDLDRDEQLAKGEKYLNTAIAGIKAQQANPALPAAAQAQLKQSDAEAHKNLAFIGLTRATANKDADPKKFDQAISEMKIASDEDPAQTAYQAQLAAILHQAGKNAESLAVCNKILAMTDVNPAIKSYVENVAKEDGGPAPAAAPAK